MTRCGNRCSRIVRELVHCLDREPLAIGRPSVERRHCAAGPSEDGFELRDTFATSAATDVTSFQSGGAQYVVVANSLDSDLKFRTDTVVYRFLG